MVCVLVSSPCSLHKWKQLKHWGLPCPWGRGLCLWSLKACTGQLTQPQLRLFVPDSQTAQDGLFKLHNLQSRVLRSKVRLNSSAICAVSDTQSYGCWSYQLFQYWPTLLEKFPPTESDPCSLIWIEQSSCVTKRDIIMKAGASNNKFPNVLDKLKNPTMNLE